MSVDSDDSELRAKPPDDRYEKRPSGSRLVRHCLRAARINLAPGLALQAVALVVVGAYYFAPSTREAYEWIGAMKAEHGYAYSAITTAVFGGLIPFAYLATVGRIRRGSIFSVGLFFVLFWSFKGIEVDFLYRMQALMFGEASNAATVAKKVVFDQFIYCPIWSAPVTALLYRWKDCAFSWRLLRATIDRDFFLLEIPTVLVAIWIVWIPGTAFVYSMPSALQLPLFSLVLCFFVLLVSVLGKESNE